MALPRFVNLDEQAKIGSCTTAILADGAVTTPKIAVGAVTDAALAAGSVTADKLAPSLFGMGLVFNGITDAIDVNVDSSTLVITANTLLVKDAGLGAIKFKSSVFGQGLVHNFIADSIDINPDNVTLEIVSNALQIKPLGVTVPYININTDLSFNDHQALSFRVENVSVDPAPGNVGRLIWRTDTSEFKIDTGTSFINAGGHNIQDDGTPFPQRPILNFTGTGVTVSDTGTKTQVDIPGNFQYYKDSFSVTDVIANHSITLFAVPQPNSEVVSWNGLVLRAGVTFDYTISSNVITLNASIILTIGDQIQIVYAY